MKKELVGKKLRKCRWPPPEGDMEEDEDDDDPDGKMKGCEYCADIKSINPQLAWNAFYVDGNSLSETVGALAKGVRILPGSGSRRLLTR